ncbi:MAG: PIG-L deacetylase family protein [Candidatus Parvarchaeota archaeon]
MDLSTFLDKTELNEVYGEIIQRSRRIISIVPHPDDNELIAGGLIASKIAENSSFLLVVISDGRKGSRTLSEEELVYVRRKEQEEALNILGSKNLKFLKYRDTEIPPPSVLRDEIIKIIRDFEPDLVISVDPFLPYEAHPDHINTGHAVLQAVLFADFPNIGIGKPVSRPNIALGFTHNPNVIVDCSKTMSKKMAAIRAHKSQFPDDSSVDIIWKISEIYGKRIGKNYAEAFRVLTPSELHVNILGGMNLR